MTHGDLCALRRRCRRDRDRDDDDDDDDARLWRMKLIDAFPFFADPVLQKVLVNVPKEEHEQQDVLDNEWRTLCQWLGFMVKKETSPEKLTKDPYQNDKSPSDGVVLEEEHGGGADETEEKPKSASSEGRFHDTNTLIKMNQPPRGIANGLTMHASHPGTPDWRHACLTLLRTTKNWTKGHIRLIQRLPAPADVLCLDFDEARTRFVHAGCFDS